MFDAVAGDEAVYDVGDGVAVGVVEVGEVDEAVAEAVVGSARGMSWLRRGVSALMQLRLLRLNGTWQRYWAQRFAAALRPWPSAA